MSNSWFRFKEFTVHQDRCAMKVSTDACIQGAWTPVHQGMKNVLDIGTGTGLLSLMIAQRLPEAEIDAVEINAEAAKQAAKNIESSPFSNRIKLTNGDVTVLRFIKQYDLIICNPPFFSNSLASPDDARNAARHAGVLNQQSLRDILLRGLSSDGFASIMWPPAEHESFANFVDASGIQLQASLQVRDSSGSHITRVVGMYSRNLQAAPLPDTLAIKDDEGGYTKSFTDLLSPFYLNL